MGGKMDCNRDLVSRFGLKKALKGLLQMFLVLCPPLLADYLSRKLLGLTGEHLGMLSCPL